MKFKTITLGIAPTLKVGTNYFKPSATVVVEIEEGEDVVEVAQDIQSELKKCYFMCLETEMEIAEEVEAIEPDDKPAIRKVARKRNAIKTED